MIKSLINHQPPPSTPTAMSILINPLPHPASILFKTTLKQKPRLHSISFSTPASRKSPVCFSYSSSSSSSSFNEPSNAENEKLGYLKRAFVDKVRGTNFGFTASTEVRAEALELITRLEAANPTPAPTEAREKLDGNWILVYTAFSEPLLAAGNVPLAMVEKISQSIDFSTLTIEYSIMLTFSFSASATFEVQSPTRIQVQFKEPLEIKSDIDPPENVNDFEPTSAQQPSDPPVASIVRVISGQPPPKIPISGERTKSWLLITYLDKDFRISWGDSGLFVLAKEGSPLLYQ